MPKQIYLWSNEQLAILNPIAQQRFGKLFLCLSLEQQSSLAEDVMAIQAEMEQS